MADRFNNRALSAFTTLIAACSVFLYLVSSTTTTVTSLSTHQPHMADYPILRNLRPPAGAVACDRWWECAGPKRYHVGFGDHHSAQRMARWLVRRSLCWRAPPPTPPRVTVVGILTKPLAIAAMPSLRPTCFSRWCLFLPSSASLQRTRTTTEASQEQRTRSGANTSPVALSMRTCHDVAHTIR